MSQHCGKKSVLLHKQIFGGTMIKLGLFSYQFSILFCLYILLVATSCAPAVGTYYKPSYPDNSAIIKIKKGGPGAVDEGLPAHIELSVKDGVRIEANVRRWAGSLELLLHLRVPPGSSAQFETNRIILTNLKSGKKQELEIGRSLSDRIVKIPTTTQINLDKIVSTNKEGNYLVFNDIFLSNFTPNNLQIVLPEIMINDQKYKPPVIDLTTRMVRDKELKNRMFFTTVYRKKERKDTAPVTRYETLFKLAGLTLEHNLLRFLNFPTPYKKGLKNKRLQGELRMTFRPITKWHFLSNKVRFIDTDTGEERNVAIYLLAKDYGGYDFSELVYGDDKRLMVPINEIFFIKTISKEPLESVVIKLPDIVINGRKTSIKPITFKKSIGAFIAAVP